MNGKNSEGPRDGRSLTVAARKSGKPLQGKKYWRSLNELADKPEFREFVEREFPAQASEWLGGGESRRSFLKVMGASMALAGLASCRRWPDEKLVPYAHRPANRMDGVPVHYATAFERGGIGQGVVAVSFDGRPIKVDGNPMHPLNRGSSDMFLQATILDLYDPDRSRGPVKRDGKSAASTTWDAVEQALLDVDKASLVVLSEASRSPSVARLRGELVKAGAKWFEYEAAGGDNQREGAKRYFGKPLVAVPRLADAAVIVSVDADLFGPGEPLAIKFNKDFAAGRMLRDSSKAADAKMNRLYVVESGFSITGSMADHRRGIKPSDIGTVVAAIAARAGLAQQADVAIKDKALAEFVEKLAADIGANKGKAVLVAGTRQPAEVHAAVAAINAAINAPVDYFADAEDPRPQDEKWSSHFEQLKAFAEAAKGAKTVLVMGANPVLTAPADLKIADVLAGKGIHVGTHEDETAQACAWHVPLAHYLEAWGDVRSFDGTVSIAQPLIEPIFGAKSAIEILAMVLGKKTSGYDMVCETAKADYMKGGFSEMALKKALVDGIVPGSARKPEGVAANASKANNAVMAVAKVGAGAKETELALFVGAAHDGRFANNGWMMETPDAMTRVSWENSLLVSPKAAETFAGGVVSDDEVTLTANGQKVDARVYVLPGHPDDTVSIAVGYGRKGVGNVAEETGANAWALRGADGAMLISGVTAEKTGRRPIVACVQDHHTIDAVGKNRLNQQIPELVVEGTFEQYKKKPALGTRKILALSIFNEYSYDKGEPWVMAKWGMAIDLTVCTGCSACVVACQAENNVPVVGKQMVYRGREMQWLRIDRYFKFARDEKTGKIAGDASQGTAYGTGVTPDEVQVVHQPVLCMHCENAPCEEVCPVAATTHSHEGLNMMTYNRCIGTRYCSNNCPYKVRRFNFFDFNSGQTVGKKDNLYTPNLLRDDLNELSKMQKNPQVTIRSRGVMEKCTYCVQRIEAARIEVRAKNRRDADNQGFDDGSVVTACQQACPTDAIVFGDLNDKNSRVAKMHAVAQSYGLLDTELNTKPRTQYLAKVRNNTAGLDEQLYNEHTASEGWFYEEGNETGAAEGKTEAPTK